ncbi:MAG TPA: class I SAM-dependent methyltransferase [Rhizomicrobium sp.]|jgi:S-adenosylmethionine-diacylgycerolhomoserine-N-methlytransferase
MSMTDSIGDHTELMDSVYRRQRYIYDFTRKYYLLGRDRLIRELDLAPGAKVVEIGCGTGRNLVKLAQRYPGVSFYGLDASREMLKSAERAVAQSGLSERIGLAHGLAEDLSSAMFGLEEPFTDAIFSYSLSMIPDWKQALMKASAAVGTGRVHIVDFGDLEGLGAPVAALLRAWLRLFHVTPRKEILQRIESQSGFMEQTESLRILPAHYAFIWQGSGKAVQSLAL